MRKIKKKFLSIVLIIEILFISIVTSFFMPIGVFALSAGGLQTTIASIIISLMLECGAAPVNQSWITALNNSYGVESSIGTIQDCINSGLLTESGGSLIDSGLSAAIESQSAYTDLNLSQLFTTTADDAVSGAVAASGGVNLTNTAINCGTLGTIGAFAGAASIGVGLGVLASKVNSYIANFVKFGFPMTPTTIQQIQNSAPDGYDNCLMVSDRHINNVNDQQTNFYFGSGNILYGLIDNYSNGLDGIVGYNFNDGNVQTYWKQYFNSRLTYEGNGFYMPNNQNYQISTENTYRPWLLTNAKNFSSLQDFNDYVSAINNGNIEFPETYAPDIIGQNGNMKPNQMQTMVPDGYDMNPVDIDDYQDYADGANNNTENDNVGRPVQGEEFENLIDSLLVEPSVIPDQGITDPDVPERPIIPDQPEVPSKDPITSEEQSAVLEGITTPDLRSVFPFCIPFDLFALLGELKDVNREAPVIVWEMPEELGGYSIILDFSMFDEAARLLRLLELALFILGLAVETRKLIGAKG